MFEQAAIAVTYEKVFAQLHGLIDQGFASQGIETFLDRVARAKLRIRDYESVLARGFLSKEAIGLYAALPVSDQALTRERYLRLVEAVAPELRQRYFKVYAYY